tara:strand:- start:53 stop:1249 length:1197 start_codon:yes stop_codon:yes gene_type:complete
MPNKELTKFLLLPKLELTEFHNIEKTNSILYHCNTTQKTQYCPHCGLETSKVHDRRVIKIKDAPQTGRNKILKITKKRFRCTGLGCKKVFTECIQGIAKRARVTERMNREILYTCDKFSNMKQVSKHTNLGNKTIYKKHYRQLELKWRERKDDPWPRTVGIDEHSWLKNKKYGYREFATVVVDYNNKRVKELIPGRIAGQLAQSLAYIPGRERVKNVVMDLSKPYKSFAKDFFPNAKLIADKFHVVRLLNPTINKYRKQITGDKRKNPIRKLLLKSSIKLDFDTRRVIQKWLKEHPDLEAIYYAKEAIMKLYRCKGRKIASKSLTKLTDILAMTKVKELQTLRRTLMSWREEILNYFENRITNARTEGYNNVCKQLQKRAYGYRNFNNYRLKVLNVCC